MYDLSINLVKQARISRPAVVTASLEGIRPFVRLDGDKILALFAFKAS